MELLKLLLHMLILNYGKSFHDVDLTTEHRLPVSLIPDHYDIKLEQPKQHGSKYFDGLCLAYVRLLFPMSFIRLHAQKPHIRLNNTVFRKTDSPEVEIVPDEITYNTESHMYQFKFKKELSHGHYVVNITFTSFLDDNESFFQTSYKNITGENE